MADVVSVPQNRSRIPNVAEKLVRKAMRQVGVSGAVTYGPNLRLGMGATVRSYHGLALGHTISIGQRSVIEVDGRIGNYCLIGRHVQILGRLDHKIDEVGVPIALSRWVGDRAADARDRVTIEDDVWLGAGAVVLGGVTIGFGSVVGAGSIVTKDIEPFAIVVGNPAKQIGQRFNSDAEREAHRAALAILV